MDAWRNILSLRKVFLEGGHGNVRHVEIILIQKGD